MKETQEYKVLARKYRPQTFSDLIGQDTIVQILTNAINSNRVAHAYLLTGVRGVGKTTTARLIAMSLNCQNKKTDICEPCGKCDSCNTITNDHNLDVIEMDAASKTGVDDVREIIDNVKYKPVNSTFKIFIIDEVHMLSKNAFNALLKTLEEPPNHVKFIFATTEVKKIPVTILSRCQRFDLHRIENKELTNFLDKICKLENVKIDQEAIALIVRAADGSVRDSLSLLDQAVANNQDNISSKLITEMLGIADRGKIFELLENILKGNATEAINIYHSLHKSGADVIMIFDELLNAVHFITQLKINPNLKDEILIPELERVQGSSLAANLSMASIGIVWQVLFKGYQELQSGFHIFQHGEMIILRLIFLYDGPGPRDLLKKIESNDESDSIENNNQVEKKISNEIRENKTINFKNEPVKLNTQKFSSLNVSTFRKFVDLFYENREGMLHSQLYNNVKLISFDEGKLVLNSSNIKDPHFNRTIAKLISKWTGRIWQIESSSSNLGKSLNEEDIINQQAEIEKMKNHPEIKKILETFPGIKIHSITDIGETSDETSNEIKKEKEL